MRNFLFWRMDYWHLSVWLLELLSMTEVEGFIMLQYRLFCKNPFYNDLDFVYCLDKKNFSCCRYACINLFIDAQQTSFGLFAKVSSDQKHQNWSFFIKTCYVASKNLFRGLPIGGNLFNLGSVYFVMISIPSNV